MINLAWIFQIIPKRAQKKLNLGVYRIHVTKSKKDEYLGSYSVDQRKKRKNFEYRLQSLRFIVSLNLWW